MQIVIKEQSIIQSDVSVLVVGVIEEAAITKKDLNLSEILMGPVGEVLDLGDFKGKKDESTLLYTRGAVPFSRLMLVGLGKKKDLTVEKVRSITGALSRRVRDLGTGSVGVSLDHFVYDLDTNDVIEAIVEGFIMGSFNHPFYKTKDLDKFKQIKELHLITSQASCELENRIEQGRIIAEAVNFCRKLSWASGNRITPTRLSEEALKLQEYGLNVTIFDREESEKIGLHSFLAVARGTDEPPKFIIMEYGSDKEGVETIALVGKAITFDTGGISLKNRDGMSAMKSDMTGGAVVISAMKAIAKLGLDLHVVGIVPSTDNMPSGKAYHPGDVVDSYAGITIEVISTDAEGRMILNDALAYAAKNYKPSAMFDFATLTGSISVALGEHAIGYFANDDSVSKRLEKSSKKSGEAIWRMPLWEVYDHQLKSDVADWKHTGGRPGGAITAARFLSKFVMDLPWAHLDIAGVDEQKSDKGYNPKGSRGPSVRLIIDVLRNWKS